MPESTKEESLQLFQARPISFTLFDQNGIRITLDLPGALQLNQNTPELFTCAPILHNDTTSPIESATFTIELDDVTDFSKKVIANVRWWNSQIYDGLQTVEFTCGAVKPGETGTCIPNSSGYSQVRWAPSASIGRGTETFTLTYEPFSPKTPVGSSGPLVQIG
jgi:hypothetical protein